MIDKIKQIIKENLTDTDLPRTKLPRGFNILAIAGFWVKENFSAIIKYKGQRYYTCFDHTLKDIKVELMKR